MEPEISTSGTPIALMRLINENVGSK